MIYLEPACQNNGADSVLIKCKDKAGHTISSATNSVSSAEDILTTMLNSGSIVSAKIYELVEVKSVVKE